jgi:hypothetical protein
MPRVTGRFIWGRGPADATLLRELTRFKEFDGTSIMCEMPRDAALRAALQFLDLRMQPTDRLTPASYRRLQRWLTWIEGSPLDGLCLERLSTGWCRIRRVPRRDANDQRVPGGPLSTGLRRAVDDAEVERILGAVLDQWLLHLGFDKEYTAREVISRAVVADAGGSEAFEFRDALLAAAGKGGAINSGDLGTWLGKNRGRLLGGRRIVKAKISNGVQYWKLTA